MHQLTVPLRLPFLLIMCLILVACGAADGDPPVGDPSPTPPGGQPPGEEAAITADAGTDRTAAVSEQVQLNGRGSSREPPGLLEFSWELLIRPEGSSASLSDSTSRTPTLTPDSAGVYVAGLTVTDGVESANDTVTVTAVDPLVVDAGASQSLRTGQVAMLHGQVSGAGGAPLEITWQILSAPPGSTAVFENASVLDTAITPDLPGNYILELGARDGSRFATARTTLTAITPSAADPTALHVAENGDDDAAGDEGHPLATVGEALRRAAADSQVSRVLLGPGRYEAEPFGYQVAGALQIAGPAADDGAAVLVAAADGFEAVDGGQLSLIRLTIEAGSTAAYAAVDSRVSMVDVTCHALQCAAAGRPTFPFTEAGGELRITGSELHGTGSGTGINVREGAPLTVTGSVVQGFETGLLADHAGTVILQDSAFLDNGTGVFAGTDSQVRGSGIRIRQTFQAGLTIEWGSAYVRFVDSEFSSQVGVGVRFEGSPFPEITVAPMLVLRDTEVAAPFPLRIGGRFGIVDLGVSGDAGNNVLRMPEGELLAGGAEVPLLDERPADAGGFVTLNRTFLGTSEPAPGVHQGPLDTPQLRIVNAGNSVVVVGELAEEAPADPPDDEAPAP